MAQTLTVADMIAILLKQPQDAEFRVTHPLDTERSVNSPATGAVCTRIGPLVYVEIT